MIKCIIFDLDNTLFNQVEYIKNLMKHIAYVLSKKYNLDQNKTAKILISYWMDKGPFYGRFFDDLVEKFSIDKNEVKNLIHISHTHKPSIEPYPHVHDILSKLQKKYNLALITDGNENTQKNKVQALGLEKYFSRIFYATAENMKPSPNAYNAILKHFKLKPEQAVYVADNPNVDFISPNKIKMPSIRVLTGYFKDVNIGSARESTHTMQNIEEIFDVLDELQGK